MYSREELKQLKRDFWIGFDDYCNQHHALKNRRTKFMLYNTKVKGVELKFDAHRYGAEVILEVNAKNTERRMELYGKLKACRMMFEEVFGDQLVWTDHFTRECGSVVSRIYLCQSGLDMHIKAQWPEFYAFMSENMILLENLFLEVKEFLE